MAAAVVEAKRPVVTVRRAPALDPPYEGQAQPPPGMQMLPLEWSGPRTAERTRPARAGDFPAQARAGERPTGDGEPVLKLPPGALPRPATRPRPLPPTTARAAAQRFVGMCVEVLNGFRPAAQLRPVAAVQRFNDIADQLVRRAVRMRLTPGQAARQGRLLRVRRMLLCEPRDGVAEAAVVLEQGQVCWAMAVRLERSAEGWRCTVLQVV
jgi:Family of unknown function (DUF6459)